MNVRIKMNIIVRVDVRCAAPIRQTSEEVVGPVYKRPVAWRLANSRRHAIPYSIEALIVRVSSIEVRKIFSAINFFCLLCKNHTLHATMQKDSFICAVITALLITCFAQGIVITISPLIFIFFCFYHTQKI